MSSAPPRPVIPQLSELPLVIETPRLVLRPLAPEDADELYACASDPELARTMSWSAHANIDETRAWLAEQVELRAKNTTLGWAVTLAGRPIGCVAYGGIRWDFRAWRIDRAELGYWLGRPHWGQGYMSEAALAATRWGFETLGLHKITIGCIAGNVASQKIIEKLGYRFLAVFEEDFWRDGRWQDHRRYELCAGEWADTTRTLRFTRSRPPT